ncbi:MAG: inositol monophosphatase [Deltaproteobacteria bacterium]|nr:inositol monophosphatase [Deltaproteobacteria bacterium]
MEVIHEAGDKALSYYGKGKPNVKFDESIVTQAELDITECFQEQLKAHFPEHQLFRNFQEERGYSHDDKRYLWVFDPLDGVANFQAGIPIWGMSVALVENFWPLFGIFYMPVTNDLFYGRAGEIAFLGDDKIRVSSQASIDDESLMLTYSRFHHRFHTSFPGKIRDFGCTGAHICYVAMGRAEAALIFHESYQGLAAARVIIEAAGGKSYKLDGKELFLNEYLDGDRINDHLLVVAPDKFVQVRSCLKEVTPQP